MPRPLPQSLAEALPQPPAVDLAADAARTLDGVGLPGGEPISAMGYGAGQEHQASTWTPAVEARNRMQALVTATGLGLVVPELSSPEFGRVTWDNVLTSYGALEAQQLQPEVVVGPSGRPLEFWRGMFSKLRAWQDTNRANATHRLQKRDDGDGLYVNDDVASNWNNLVDTSNPGWTVAVLSTAPKAPFLNIDHDGKDKDGRKPDELESLLSVPGMHLHPSPESYLGLQAVRLLTDQQPLDDKVGGTYYWSWLDGTFGQGLAPGGDWRPGYGRVYLDWDGVDGRVDNLGVRPAGRG